MPYVLLFFQILFYTLGVPVICGLVVGLCRLWFQYAMGRGFGRGLVMATSIVGTPVHEMGHAIMCLLFGHKIDEIALWRPQNRDGVLGYVTHRYNPKNPYHQLGNIFIGLGPVFSGLGVMILCMVICFPETMSTYAENASELVGEEGGLLALMGEGAAMIPHLLEEWPDGGIPLWGRIIALIVMLSVSLHISLSPLDIKGALGGVPVYLVLTLVATVVVSLMGESAMTATAAGLQFFSAATFALFMLVFLLSLVWVILGLAVLLIRKMLHLK